MKSQYIKQVNVVNYNNYLNQVLKCCSWDELFLNNKAMAML